MNLPKWGWITAKLLVILLVPTLLYVWICQTVLTSHLKNVITNDPEAGLTRTISALKISLDEEYQILFSQIGHTTDKDWLQKSLANSKMTLVQYQQLGTDLASYLQRPLLILTNKDGEVLFDNINLPKAGSQPEPTATITPLDSTITSDKSPAAPQSKLFSVKDWPGFAEVFQKTTQMGLFSYSDQYYLAVAAPIVFKKKIVGAIVLGIKLNSDILQRLKTITQNEVAFYANNKIQLSTFANNVSPDLNKTAFAPRNSAITIGGQNFLWDDVPINDLDQVVAGHFFVFQPIRQSITLDGSFLKADVQWGFVFVLVVLALGLWYTMDLLSPLRRITELVNQIKDGKRNIPLPIKRLDQWGDLARSIHQMIQNWKDRERISLVLGKVISAQATQKLLAEKNYFAIKGERRECTLLQAKIMGFNIRSRHMTPEVLVEVLNQYLSLINEAVFKHEGMVDKFVGETAIALWGAPLACEDKEIRAAKTALEIQNKVRELNTTRVQKGLATFSLGIGIHTGTVVSGNLGSDQYYDYSVIGEPLQTVNQICTMAALGQIILSEETYKKIKDLVRVTPANPLLAADVKKTLKTYEINGLL